MLLLLLIRKVYFIFYDISGYLPAVLCLLSQARPLELQLAAINGGIVPSFTKHLALMFKLQG